MKNKILVIALILITFSSCKKDDPAPGSLDITVSYYYNAYQGYKPDVGAKAFLFESKYSSIAYQDSMNVVSARVGILNDKMGERIISEEIFEGEADVNGNITILDIPDGEYFLLVSSEGRWTYSTKTIIVEPNKTLYLVKNFYYFSEWEPAGEPW